MNDEQITKILLQYKGIGLWTVQNILIFGLKDVMALVFVLIIVGGFSTLCYLSNNVEGYDDMVNLIFGVPTF